MKAGVNVYVSDWGQFVIPDEIYEATKWRKWWARNPFAVDTDDGPMLQTDAEEVPENQPFFDWLRAEEVKAGRPDMHPIAQIQDAAPSPNPRP